MQVQSARDRLAQQQTGVIAIGFSPQPRLDQLRAELGLTFTLLSDPGRRWYAAFNVPRGHWWTVFAPRILAAYLRLARAGYRLRWSGEDLRQLGAGVLLRSDEVVHTWVTDESERRPSLEEILDAAHAATLD